MMLGNDNRIRRGNGVAISRVRAIFYATRIIFIVSLTMTILALAAWVITKLDVWGNQTLGKATNVERVAKLPERKVSAIIKANDAIWIGTDQGVYCFKDSLIEMIKMGKAPVTTIIADTMTANADTIWIGTEEEIFSCPANHNELKPKPVPLPRARINVIRKLGDKIWIGTEKGAYHLEKDGPVFVNMSDKRFPIITFAKINSEIWIGTNQGLFCWTNQKQYRIPPQLEERAIYAIEKINNDEIWIGTDKGIYKSTQDGFTSAILELAEYKVNIIAKQNSEVWIGTDHGAYWLDRYGGISLGTKSHVHSIVKVNSEVWIGTNEGVYQSKKKAFIPELKGQKIFTMTKVDSVIWVGTNLGAYTIKPIGEAARTETNSPLDRIPVISWGTLKLLIKLTILSCALCFLFYGWHEKKKQIEKDKEQVCLAAEVKQATEKIERLLPEGMTYDMQRIHIAHRRIAAETVSGDFYNFIPRSDGSLGIYFVDVEGHGLDASIQFTYPYQELINKGWGSGTAWNELEMADEWVSRSAIFQNGDDVFCMNFIEIDPRNPDKMEIRYANAGMPFPLLFRWNEAHPQILRAAGVYVGGGYRSYLVEPKRVVEKVGHGDLLVIFSDGILEAHDKRGNVFGQEGIIAAVYRARYQDPTDIVQEIVRAVQKHSGREQPEDDQTLLVAQIGDLKLAPHQITGKTLKENNGVFMLVNAENTDAVCRTELWNEVKIRAKKLSFIDDRISQIWEATREAIQNAVKFGSKRGEVIKIRLLPNNQEKFFEVILEQPRLWEDWNDFLGLARSEEVHDTGPLTIEKYCQQISGTVVMLRLADHVEVTDSGRKTTMRFFATVKPERKVSLVLNA